MPQAELIYSSKQRIGADAILADLEQSVKAHMPQTALALDYNKGAYAPNFHEGNS